VSWFGDVGLIISTLLAPALAIEAQKIIDRRKEAEREKKLVFAALMYTRATRVSIEHVQAINRIEIAYYKDNGVMAAWKEYLDALNTPTPDANALAIVGAKRNDLFINLLYAMSTLLKYPFTKTDIKNTAYIPMAHTDLETEKSRARKGMLDILEGRTRLGVDVVQPGSSPTPGQKFIS
jgi:hypothetical protein